MENKLTNSTNLTFDLNLLKNLNTPNEDLTISPVSIYLALALTANGAMGETRSQILSALEHQQPELQFINKKCQEILTCVQTCGDNQLQIANAVMSIIQPKSSFQELASKLFKAKSSRLESAEGVNEWCSANTNGKITKILESIDGIQMIILNAVYFLGLWEHQFDKEKTQEDSFYTSKNEEKKVMFMRNKFEKARIFKNQEAQVISLPYKGNSLSAMIVLPQGNIDSFVQELTQDKLDLYIKNSFEMEVTLHLPKFESEYTCSLGNVLSGMGIKAAFTPDADFSQLSEDKLKIDDVVHKTYIKVDEKGTEAAAVTGVIMVNCMMMIREIEIKVNRPFLFFIRHHSMDKFLFVSKIENI